MKLFRKIKKGFTLVELVVVIAVIAILAAVSVGAYFGVTESAKDSKLEQESKQIYTAIQIVGNSNSSNHQLDADGLHIVDTEVFEDEINEVTSGNYNVYKEGEPVAGNAIVLKEKVVSGLEGAKTYSTFEYYTTETGKKAGVVDVVTGNYSKTTNENIEINQVYTTAEEVNKAINDGKTLITFGASVVFDDNLLIDGKTVTLDLNGHTISSQYKNGAVTYTSGNETYQDIFVVRAINGANVTITGNGKMQFVDNSKEFNGAAAILAAYPGSTIIVENGEYVSKPWNGATVLYSKDTGLIEVKDGIFNALGEHEETGRSYAFNTRCVAENCGLEGADYEDHDCKVDHFKVSGGVFYREGNNPKSFTNGCTHNFLEQGYDVVTGEDNGIVTYTVVKAA